ncbi:MULTISPECIES: hypothetical protein [unclassified Caballeronia]|uniref:hypothetical protein n=1 Tax=unclassified Caballeronia TaxID=2646786 RepID=UPI002856AC58|nr:MULTISPECIES: hypothetical protein [unclassified Caballeronia]MDR5771795.1 hypothetical protein [Caballeronia sp. LZ002]MDR5847230.1 hypothetical protein [Caballeronia sp. LZ003]
MSINFSLGNDGGVVVQQSSGTSGSSTTFGGGSAGGSQSSGQVAQGGTDIASFANAERRQGVFGSGLDIDSFNKLTQGMIQPYIDRAKKEQYADGMAQAAQGRSLIEIENDQPWYTKLYGPDATVQGAQIFNVNAAMNDAQTQFMQAMPLLREKSPDQVRSYVVDKMSKVQPTGDAWTDAMVQQKLAEQMPQMLSQHMAQYVQFTQEQNYNGFTNMATTAAKAMQSTLGQNPNLTDDDVNAAHENFLGQIARPPNMDLNSYQRALRDVTVSNAMTGNWQAVQAIKKSSDYQSLDAGMKAELEDKIPRLEAQWAMKNPDNTKGLEDVHTLEFRMTQGVSPYATSAEGHAAATAQMESVNAAWRLRNGDAIVPFTPEKIAETLQKMDANNLRQQRVLQRAQLRQLNFEQGQTVVANAWASDHPEALKGIPIPEGAQVQVLNGAWQDALKAKLANGESDPTWNTFWQHASANARESDMQPPLLKGYIGSTMGTLFDGTGPATAQQRDVIGLAQKLREGPGGAGAVKSYFGDNAESVLAILDSGADLTDRQQFDMLRTQRNRGKLAQANAADKKEALSYVQNQSGPWWNPFRQGTLSAWDISDGNKQLLAGKIADRMATKKAAFGLSDDDAARMAYQEVVGSATAVPGALIPEDKGRFGPGQTFKDFVAKVPGATASQDSKLYQDSMREEINDLARNAVKGKGADMANFNPDDYHVQWGTYIGGGNLNLNLMRKGDHAPLNITVDAASFGKRMAKKALDSSYGNKPGDVIGDPIAGVL